MALPVVLNSPGGVGENICKMETVYMGRWSLSDSGNVETKLPRAKKAG